MMLEMMSVSLQKFMSPSAAVDISTRCTSLACTRIIYGIYINAIVLGRFWSKLRSPITTKSNLLYAWHVLCASETLQNKVQ